MKLKRYQLKLDDKDLKTSDGTPTFNEDNVEFESPNVYKLLPLVFGGFLAFDSQTVHCYKKKIRFLLSSKKLKRPLRVTAVCLIDEFDAASGKTKEGTSLLRYILGTHCGSLYMIAFDLRYLHLLTTPTSQPSLESTNFMTVEYLGS